MEITQKDLRVTGGTVKYRQPKQLDRDTFLDECPIEDGQVIAFDGGDHAPFSMTVKHIEETDNGWDITLENREG